jgi:hypothetical protein
VAPTTTALAAHVRTVRITSEPSGAAVKESDEVLCGATPCEITWRGDEATKEHELEFSKRGYATVTETVAIEAEQHSAKLKAAVVQARPGPGPGPAVPPVQPPPPAPEAKPKGLSGYKDSPY